MTFLGVLGGALGRSDWDADRLDDEVQARRRRSSLEEPLESRRLLTVGMDYDAGLASGSSGEVESPGPAAVRGAGRESEDMPPARSLLSQGLAEQESDSEFGTSAGIFRLALTAPAALEQSGESHPALAAAMDSAAPEGAAPVTPPPQAQEPAGSQGGASSPSRAQEPAPTAPAAESSATGLAAPAAESPQLPPAAPLGSGGGDFAMESWGEGAGLDGPSGPCVVVEWNNGLTLSTGAVEHDSESDSVDLRAQVQGATVSSYAWDMSAAPDATSVSGTSTYHLVFTWRNITYGNYADDRVRLTVTYTDDSEEVKDYNFRVINDGTAQGSGGGTPVSVTRPEVTTPDLLGYGPKAIGGDGYAIASATGALSTAYAAPSYNPGAPPLGLVYNSEAAAPKPIFLDRYHLNPAMGIPPTVSAKLTFNSVQGQEYYYDTSGLNPGDIMQIALQGDARSLSTGRYDWRIDVTAHYSGGDVSSYTTGTVTVINHSSDPAGTGWQVAGVDRLYPVTGGAILDLGGGQSLWFAWNSGTQTYITPAGDFSTLVKNQNNTYTRTLKSGEAFNYDTTGKQTSFVDRNSNTTSYAYDGNGKLTTITDPNSLATAFAYTSGLLSSITDPASRATDITHDGNGRITAITQPDDEAWGFTYDTSGRMTSRTDPRDETAEFSYSFAGRISEVTRADATSDALVPGQVQGLLQSGSGTSNNPGAAVLLALATSVYTDGLENDWETYYDWSGFGTETGDLDPADNLFVTHCDANGLPSETTEPARPQHGLRPRQQGERHQGHQRGLELRDLHLQQLQRGDPAHRHRGEGLRLLV